jgi:hypothetical protein
VECQRTGLRQHRLTLVDAQCDAHGRHLRPFSRYSVRSSIGRRLPRSRVGHSPAVGPVGHSNPQPAASGGPRGCGSRSADGLPRLLQIPTGPAVETVRPPRPGVQVTTAQPPPDRGGRPARGAAIKVLARERQSLIWALEPAHTNARHILVNPAHLRLGGARAPATTGRCSRAGVSVNRRPFSDGEVGSCGSHSCSWLRPRSCS